MKKKRLTLNYVWSECIKMYTYVAKKKQEGDKRSVGQLKRAWVGRRGYKNYELSENCFFCEYSLRHPILLKNVCTSCPGKLADSHFQCSRTRYNWGDHPDLFLKEILRLDKERRAK